MRSSPTTLLRLPRLQNLCPLLQPENIFKWEDVHTLAFENVKRALVSPAVLAHYDPTLPTMLQTDTSRLKGLDFAIIQKHSENWKLVQAGSRFITE